MKPVITLPLSFEQSIAINPILTGMKAGEGLMAQVYPDGLRLKVLTVEEAKAVGYLLGVRGERISSTATDANQQSQMVRP